MTIESIVLSGGVVNRVERHGGVVVKTYQTQEGIGISPAIRKQAEIHALSHVPFSPRLLDVVSDGIVMEYVGGDGCVDETIGERPERVASRLYGNAGSVLSQIHSAHRCGLNGLETGLFLRMEELLQETGDCLRCVGLDPEGVKQFCSRSFQLGREKLVIAGGGLTHGDFWLNNFLCRELPDSQLEIGGIIDWERSWVGSPYRDFGVVQLSIINRHSGSDVFWCGYGQCPDQGLVDLFACMQLLDWMRYDQKSDFSSPFYLGIVGWLNSKL